MIKRYQNSAGVLTRFADALIVGGAWLLAYPLRFQLFQFIPYAELPEIGNYLALLPFVLVLWVASFQMMGVYRYDRVLKRSTEIYTLIRVHFATLVIFTSLTYFITQYRFSRGVILIFGAVVLLGSYLFRVLLRKSLRELHRKGFYSHKLMAMGEGVELNRLLQQIKRYPELGIDIVSVISPKNYDSAVELIKRYQPKSFLVSLPHTETARLDQLIKTLKDDSIEITIIPDYSNFLALGATVDRFDGVPLIQLNDSPLHGFQTIFKRLMDFTLTLAGLAVIWPVLLVVAILVKVTSKGPILYKQERMGLDGRTFNMLKFRSMRFDAESNTGAVWAIENDHRRTRFGKFLRSTSIDELPQLWNVLVGDMSLVGPRPERPVFVHKFRTEVPNYMLRHKVKTGITGWAQINGWRGDTSLEKRIECDLFYIRNWSLWLDIKILFLTVFRGFINKNAY